MHLLLMKQNAGRLYTIMSWHQKEYLVDKYTDFKKYVEKKLVKPMTITKEAGVFVCRK